MRKRITVGAVVATLALGGAGTASAHFLVVTPQGAGSGPGANVHVGQAPPAHNSCTGHNTARSSEQSPAVTFLGPPTCPS